MKPLGVIIAIALVSNFVAPPAAAGADTDEVRVLTRNIYVGADIFRVVNVDPLFLINEIVAVYETVLQTNFPERAGALADEILQTDPHLIGLQEVSLIRSQTPGDFLFGNPAPAEDIELDYLQILLDALADRGLSYEVAAVVENADVELPLITGLLQDIRLTDRDVTLVRSDVNVSNVLEQNFENSVVLNLSGVVVEFKRGFVAIDARIGARPYRFVNTHLEVGGGFGAAVQALQTPELIGALAEEYLPTILVGDFNASPDDPPAQAYAQIIAAGFVDAWPLFDPVNPGLTCCHNETVDNPLPALVERIDHVFVRNGTQPAVVVAGAEVLGDEVTDQTETGLWPSDHAGVFASLLIPVADTDADGRDDLTDNCILQANPDQRDTDADGYGNICDADFNQDGAINFADLAYMRANFLTSDPDADLNGDGMVNMADLGIMKRLFFGQPGPSALVSDR